MKIWHRLVVPVLLICTLAAPAAAHVGHGPWGFGAGAGHPLTGASHLLLALAIGLVAGALGRRAIWLLPSIFVAGLGFAWVGGFGPAAPAVTAYVVAAATVLLAVLLALPVRMPLIPAAGIVAIAGLAVGHAHFAALPVVAASAPYVAGFTATTLAVQAAAVALALVAKREGWSLAGPVAAPVIAAVAALFLAAV